VWWSNAVIYQVYVRSFQDSDGDGVGDLPGATRRLEHVAELGASAVWLSPIYPSPNADYGYDVTDFQAVEPTFGTLADLDRLIARAHELGLRVILDFVPCHTSIEHRWFRAHPEYYVWSDTVPNNWRAAFGGGAWGHDPVTGRYFLHSFFPEQADLDWHEPEVRRRIAEALAFWVARGVDGFRLDALDRIMKDERLRDDPPATEPPPFPMTPEDAKLDHVHSRNAPDVGVALQAIRAAVGSAFLVGEVYLRTSEMGPYLEALDEVFSFDAMHSGPDARRLAKAIAAGVARGQTGWVLSNHDFSRLPTRAGPGNARACVMLLLFLPGPVFMFQGDELGMGDAVPAGEPLDRNARDGFRMPMRWDTSEHAGFSSTTPWLRSDGSQVPAAVEQSADPGSMLSLVKRALTLRASLGQDRRDARVIESPPDTVVVARGDRLAAINLGDEPRPAPVAGTRLVLEARPGDGGDLSVIPPHGGWIATAAS